MRYEIVESDGAWIVRSDGVELGRFLQQDAALGHVAELLRDGKAGHDGAASLAVRYERRRA
jgi:hypothetical protein